MNEGQNSWDEVSNRISIVQDWNCIFFLVLGKGYSLIVTQKISNSIPFLQFPASTSIQVLTLHVAQYEGRTRGLTCTSCTQSHIANRTSTKNSAKPPRQREKKEARAFWGFRSHAKAFGPLCPPPLLPLVQSICLNAKVFRIQALPIQMFIFLLLFFFN